MITSTQFTAFLKENYTKEVIRDLTLKQNKYWNMVKKNESVGGTDYKVPVISASNTRRSCDFPTAQAAADNTGYQAFAVTLQQDFALASWSGKILRQSEGDANAFASVVKSEMDRTVRALQRSYAVKTTRTGTGSCGNVATSGITTVTLTLSKPEDAANFEVGDSVGVSATDGGALRGSPSYATITAIDRVGGKLTTGSNWASQISGITDADYIFKQGDAANGSTNVATEGILSWVVPAATVSASLFYGVNRSVDKQRLAGVYVDNTTPAAPIDEFLVTLVSTTQANGGDPDSIFLNPSKARQVINRMSSKIVRSEQKSGKIGFGGVELLTDVGELMMYQDINFDPTYAFVLQMDTWEVISAGAPIGILEGDDNEILRIYNADGYELRMGGYPNQVCHAPGFNAVGTI
jgi:hypothetical protein